MVASGDVAKEYECQPLLGRCLPSRATRSWMEGCVLHFAPADLVAELVETLHLSAVRISHGHLREDTDTYD